MWIFSLNPTAEMNDIISFRFLYKINHVIKNIYWIPSSAAVRYAWNWTSTHSKWLHGLEKDKFVIFFFVNIKHLKYYYVAVCFDYNQRSFLKLGLYLVFPCYIQGVPIINGLTWFEYNLVKFSVKSRLNWRRSSICWNRGKRFFLPQDVSSQSTCINTKQ